MFTRTKRQPTRVLTFNCRSSFDNVNNSSWIYCAKIFNISNSLGENHAVLDFRFDCRKFKESFRAYVGAKCFNRPQNAIRNPSESQNLRPR